MVKRLGADALHTFLLVPVGCGVDIAESQMVAPDEYERILNWFYDQSARGRHRAEGHLRAALFPRGAPAPCRRAPTSGGHRAGQTCGG